MTRAEPRIREIPLSRLALAPENVRKTPPDPHADTALKASIAALGLLENLVVRTDDPDEAGGDRYAVVAGGRRLKAMQELAAEGTFYGPGAQEVGGVFERDQIIGAFGARR